MDVLFIIPPTDLAASYGNLKSFSNPVPSLGLAYMASTLRTAGYEVNILDAYAQEMPVDRIVDYVAREKPPIVGLSVLTTSAGVVEDICRGIRRAAPETIIVGGNIHAVLFHADLLSQNLMDVVVFKEGEQTIVQIVQAVESGRDLSAVEGVALHSNGQVTVSPPRPFIQDLDSLPFPAWDLYDFSLYHNDPRTAIKGLDSQKEMQILATRGCPNECTFCSSRTERSLGKKYRMRSPQNIVNEIEYMFENHGSRVFSFMDLAFPLVEKHAMAVCDEIIARGLHREIGWFTECRVKPLRKPMLLKMRQAGCRRVCFGIESGNDSTLLRLRKNFTVAQVKKACQMAREAGLEVDGMFMLGLPEETLEEAESTIRLACSLGLRFAIFNLFVPYPGCTLYDELSAQGRIQYKTWSDFSSYWTVGGGHPVYVPDGWTPELLKRTQARAMRRFYFRPEFILRQIKDLKPSMFKLYWQGLKGLLDMGGK